MACTWRHLEQGKPAPRKLELFQLGARFGFDALYGRPLRAREVISFRLVEALAAGYAARALSADWVEWATKNKDLNALLMQAQREADGTDQR